MAKQGKLKVLILMSYYERPLLVRNGLHSIREAAKRYDNWELVFIDDGSIKEGRPVVEEILADYLHKITFYQTGMSAEEKKRDGCRIGEYQNMAVRNSKAM